MNGTENIPFELQVGAWLITCFGYSKAKDITERNFRFLEESLELVQSLGLKKEQAIALVDYVYNRPPGNELQEVGGVMVTLAALCFAMGVNSKDLGSIELMRVMLKVDEIQQKQLTKPDNIKTK